MTSWIHLEVFFSLPSYINVILHFLGLSYPNLEARPTLQNECVALQPYLASPTPPDRLYACPHQCLSINTSVCCTTSPSIIPSVCKSTHPSVTLSIHDMVSLSVIPIRLSYTQSVDHPINLSLTHQSVTQPISPAIHLSAHPSWSDHLHTILHHLSGCPSSSDHSSTIYTSPSDCLSLHDRLYDKQLSPSDCPPLPDCLYNTPLSPSAHLYDEPTSLSACLSTSDHLTATMTCLTVRPSSTMIQCAQDSSQSLAVMNGSNSTRPRNSVGPLLTMTYFYMP